MEPLLNALQKGDDYSTRHIAIEYLGKMRERRALPVLRKILSGKEAGLNSYAAVAIGRIDCDLLLSFLQEGTVQTRRAVLHGLSEVGCTQAVPLLLPLVEEKELGMWVLEALGKLGTPDLLPRLKTLIYAENYYERSAARGAIINIKERYKL